MRPRVFRRLCRHVRRVGLVYSDIRDRRASHQVVAPGMLRLRQIEASTVLAAIIASVIAFARTSSVLRSSRAYSSHSAIRRAYESTTTDLHACKDTDDRAHLLSASTPILCKCYLDRYNGRVKDIKF